MSLLSIVRRAANKIGAPQPANVFGNPEPNARLLLECANEEGMALASEWEWQALRAEQVFTASGTAIQANALPTGFDRMVADTFFNRSAGRRVVGPLTAQEWQAHRAATPTVVFDAFRFEGGNLEIIPTPPAGTTYAFEYVTRFWCVGTNGAPQSEWLADTDTALLSEDVIRLGVIWRFKQSRGLDYAEDRDSYERQKVAAMARDGARRVVSLASGGDAPTLRQPTVPDGSWVVG